MKIAVDAFPLTTKTASGIPNYTRNILRSMVGLDADHEYFLYCKNPFGFDEAPNIYPRLGSTPEANSSSYGNTLWLFNKGVWIMKKDGIDLFWGTRQMLPPVLPGMRTLLTAYDLVWHYYPETMERYNLLVTKILAKRSIVSAEHIITISESTSRDLTKVLGVPREKIDVIYPAADQYIPLDKDESADYISEKYGTNRNYVLTVSTVEPRKNLPTLLKAFSGLKSEGIQLLIAGASGWKTSSIHNLYDELGLTEKEVKFLGYVPDEDMNRLYSGARLFVFPSIYEGFGIPALEALSSGTPLIVSDRSSLPEVAGDAGVQLDPYDVEGWRAAISEVMADSELQHRMSGQGIEQAKRFSWEESARKTLKVLERYA
jgi:glycosyltransferase involved in cell wall biosynthesis